jgi:hypothetical protein
MLLVCGFLVFFAGYAGYARSYLGGIDGLPPLPEKYWPNPDSPILDWKRPRTSALEDKIKQAFGLECPELSRAIKLELRSRSMVLAAAEFIITEDGRVQLSPISIALFGKDRGDGRPVEINTIRAQTAYLKFDRPITNMNEINGRKIMEAELIQNIEIVNNRHTARRDDDLTLYIAKGPLKYEEAKQLIWTADEIDLTDYQSKPKPTKVRGKGMEMELLTEAAPPKPGPGGTPHKPKTENITGVKRIVLQADVDMHLYVDGKSGFLAGQKSDAPASTTTVAAKPNSANPAEGKKPEPAKNATPPPEVEKAHVSIKTPGRFQYDFFKDHDEARFEVPAADPDHPMRFPQDIVVQRLHEKAGSMDQLICQYLELRLRHKDTPQPAPTPKSGSKSAPPHEEATPDQSVDIETAHATAVGINREVVLVAEAEKLEAHGNDFFYDAPKLLTILKGEPEMWADKDGSLIHARELQMQEIRPPGQAADAKGYQHVTALGPGDIRMIDKTDEKKTMRAYWKDTLISTKDGPHDLLILTGAARFVDEESEQTLQAETLKVWLMPNEKKEAAEPATPPKGATANGQPSANQPRPHHVEATGNVMARSREMNVHDTSRLVVWFRDVPAATFLPASAGKEAGGSASPAADKQDKGIVPSVSPSTAPTPMPRGPAAPAAPAAEKHQAGKTEGPLLTTETPHPPAGPEKAGSPPAKKNEERAPARPIDLTARSVEAWVLRSDEKSTLDKLWTEGKVHVRQDPAKPEEKGVDIKGATLQMTYNPAGNFLVVTGSDDDFAELLMDKIYIVGPEVNIDQATNKAWVYGAGAMQMESATNFQGDKLDKTVPLTVHWSKDMFFNGEYAEFRGGIQAEQQNARLASQRLQVFFDRPISLKEGQKEDEPARVRHLVCDQDVRVEDSTFEGEQLMKYQRITATVLDMVALDQEEDGRPVAPTTAGKKGSEGNLVRASGPGTVRIVQRGGQDPLAPTPTPAAKPNEKPASGPKPATEEGLKLTYVVFTKRMDANSRSNTANFWENVRVLSMPCDNPNQEIDLETVLAATLPEGAMYLRCDRLKVLDERDNGRSNQQMEAHGRVYVQGKDFYARSDAVYYNQAKDQIIFDGTESGMATLYKIKHVGGEAQVIRGQKILYNRVTGESKVDKAESFRGESVQ